MSNSEATPTPTHYTPNPAFLKDGLAIFGANGPLVEIPVDQAIEANVFNLSQLPLEEYQEAQLDCSGSGKRCTQLLYRVCRPFSDKEAHQFLAQLHNAASTWLLAHQSGVQEESPPSDQETASISISVEF